MQTSLEKKTKKTLNWHLRMKQNTGNKTGGEGEKRESGEWEMRKERERVRVERKREWEREWERDREMRRERWTLNVLLIRPWAHFNGGLHMSESSKVNSTCICVQTCMHIKSIRIHIYQRWEERKREREREWEMRRMRRQTDRQTDRENQTNRVFS